MDISKWDLKELKALGFDLNRKQEENNYNLKVVHEAILAKEKQNAPMVPVNDSPDVPDGKCDVPSDKGAGKSDVLPAKRPTKS